MPDRDILAQYLLQHFGVSIEEFQGRGDFVATLLDFLSKWNELTSDATPAECNQIIWAIFSYPFFIPHEKLSPGQIQAMLSACEEITLSIPRIHPAGEPMENGFFMLWDLVEEDAKQSYVILEKLLEHPDIRVQAAAVHGLGHRGEPRVSILKKFLAKNPQLDNDWFQQCLDGTVM